MSIPPNVRLCARQANAFLVKRMDITSPPPQHMFGVIVAGECMSTLLHGTQRQCCNDAPCWQVCAYSERHAPHPLAWRSRCRPARAAAAHPLPPAPAASAVKRDTRDSHVASSPVCALVQLAQAPARCVTEHLHLQRAWLATHGRTVSAVHGQARVKHATTRGTLAGPATAFLQMLRAAQLCACAPGWGGAGSCARRASARPRPPPPRSGAPRGPGRR